VVRGRTVTRHSDSLRPAETRWKVRGSNPDARRLAVDLGMSSTVGEFLWQLGHRDAPACRAFLDPKLSALTSPDTMVDRARLAERLAEAIRRRERIVIFGDYDCDGITSAAILAQACERLGGEVAVELASRFDGGYGLGAAALERIQKLAPKVVVTCDCGSSDHTSLRELGRTGVDCLVIDHHLVPDEPLPALAFLNPHRPDCGYPFKGLASCGLALSVVGELRTRLGREFDLRSCLDLVAIGTIADVAPLTSDNRALVRAGLRQLEHPRRPGLVALMRRARIEPGTTVTAEDVAFRIAPRLNAPGRLGCPAPALQLLLANGDDEAERLADAIEALQLERRAQQEAMLEDAQAEIARQDWSEDEGLVVGREAYNVGIVGIVAGRLAEHYACPVVVYGVEGGIARGSVRGPRDVALYDLVRQTADCLVRYGGHDGAAGLEVELSRLDEFRQRFVQACRESRVSTGDSSRNNPATEVLLLDPKDEPMRVAKELLLLEPCGEGNRLPLLGVPGRLAAARELRGGHLRLEVERDGGDVVGGFGPRLGNRVDSLPAALMAVGTLRVSRFGGQQRAELLVRDVVRLPDEVPLSGSMAQTDRAQGQGGPA
jgi:single-stranded-DNA-specific exonuclease